MAKIHQGHDVLSLFGLIQNSKALNQNIAASRHLLISVISAFFIVVVVSLLLRFSTDLINAQSVVSAATSVVTEEQAAYIPGQFVSEKLSQGYLRF